MTWLQSAGTLTGAIILLVLCTIAWGLNFIALPGNWIGAALLAVYAWLGPSEGRFAIGGGLVIFSFAMASLGELVEFAAGALGASRAGASRRATLYAMGGSMAGAMAGAIIGVPIPFIGSILAAVLFGGIGATAGAMYAEWTDGKEWRENWTIGKAAFIGRTLGTLSKSMIGVAIVAAALLGICF